MSERYEYRTIRVQRSAWKLTGKAVLRAIRPGVEKVGGFVYGLWTPEIGFASDEGILMVWWPDEEAQAAGGTVLDDIEDVVESDVEMLVPTIRPVEPTPPQFPGIYAHRWFEVADEDVAEFLQLSATAWPDFEDAYPGVHIIGLWRTVTMAPSPSSVLLITRYPGLHDWERSRPYGADTSPAADAARTQFMRRAQITKRSIVRATRLLQPGSPTMDA